MQCFSVKGTGHFGDFGLNLGGVSRASGTKIESVTPQGLVPFCSLLLALVNQIRGLLFQAWVRKCTSSH